MATIKCKLCLDKGFLWHITKDGKVKRIPCTHWLPKDTVRDIKDYEK